MRPCYLLLSVAFLPMLAQAQLFTFGVKGGVPAETPMGQTENRMPFAAGPVVNIRIFSRISLETGILFHGFGQNSDSGAYLPLYPENAVTLTYSTTSGHALEFPVLAKVHLTSGRRSWRPFLTAGPAVRRTSFSARSLSTTLTGTPATSTPQPAYGATNQVKWNVDPAFGAGVDFKSGRFHLEPEVRYSYWGAGVNSPVRKNQVQFLFGIRL